MAIGYASEANPLGKADVMIAGGADELNASATAVFDTMFATSCRNDRRRPARALRPRSRRIGHRRGSCDADPGRAERALARGAASTPRSSDLPATPTATTPRFRKRSRWRSRYAWPWRMRALTRQRSASSAAMHGHGVGDIAESKATKAVFGERAPIHSLKSYFGHSLGACGPSRHGWESR